MMRGAPPDGPGTVSPHFVLREFLKGTGPSQPSQGPKTRRSQAATGSVVTSLKLPRRTDSTLARPRSPGRRSDPRKGVRGIQPVELPQ